MAVIAANELKELIDKIVAHVEERQHYGSFNKPKSSPDGASLNIQNPDDLKSHIYEVLNDPQTRGFSASPDGRKMYFYNDRTNTFLIIDPDSPNGGSAYRPKTPAQGARTFEKQIQLTAENYKLTDPPKIVSGGLSGVTNEWKSAASNWKNAVQDSLHQAGKASKNIAVDVGIGVAAATLAYSNGASAGEVVIAGVEPLNPAAETTDAITKSKSGEEIAKAAANDASSAGGCVAGGIGGAKLGALTSPVTGIAGPAVGGIGGCMVGAWAASGITEAVINFFTEDTDEIPMNDIKAMLPQKITPDMPPEIQALVEMRGNDDLLERTIEEMKENGSFEHIAQDLKHQKMIQEAQKMQHINDPDYNTQATGTYSGNQTAQRPAGPTA